MQRSHLIIPTMFDRRTNASMQSLQMLKEKHSESVWNDVIPVDTHFRDASKVGIPLPIMNENSRGSVAYAKLLEHLNNPSYDPSKLSHV